METTPVKAETSLQKEQAAFDDIVIPADDSLRAGLWADAKALALSGFMQDKYSDKDKHGNKEKWQVKACQYYVKMNIGVGLGLDPMFSAMNIHDINGESLMLGAHLLTALVRRSGGTFRIWEQTDRICKIQWFYDQEEQRLAGTSEFTWDQAENITFYSKKKKGWVSITSKDNWRNYPMDMLYARAVSRGFKMFFSHLAMSAVYIPDEKDEIMSKHYELEVNDQQDDIKGLEENLSKIELEPGEHRINLNVDSPEELDKALGIVDVFDETEEETAKPDKAQTGATEDIQNSTAQLKDKWAQMGFHEKMGILYSNDAPGALELVYAVTGKQFFDLSDLKAEDINQMNTLINRLKRLMGKRSGITRSLNFLKMFIEHVQGEVEGWSAENTRAVDACISAFTNHESSNA